MTSQPCAGQLFPGLPVGLVVAVPAAARQVGCLVPLHKFGVLNVGVAEKRVGAAVVPAGQMIAVVVVAIVDHILVTLHGREDISILPNAQTVIIAGGQHITGDKDLGLRHGNIDASGPTQTQGPMVIGAALVIPVALVGLWDRTIGPPKRRFV